MFVGHPSLRISISAVASYFKLRWLPPMQWNTCIHLRKIHRQLSTAGKEVGVCSTALSMWANIVFPNRTDNPPAPNSSNYRDSEKWEDEDSNSKLTDQINTQVGVILLYCCHLIESLIAVSSQLSRVNATEFLGSLETSTFEEIKSHKKKSKYLGFWQCSNFP